MFCLLLIFAGKLELGVEWNCGIELKDEGIGDVFKIWFGIGKLLVGKLVGGGICVFGAIEIFGTGVDDALGVLVWPGTGFPLAGVNLE